MQHIYAFLFRGTRWTPSSIYFATGAFHTGQRRKTVGHYLFLDAVLNCIDSYAGVYWCWTVRKECQLLRSKLTRSMINALLVFYGTMFIFIYSFRSLDNSKVLKLMPLVPLIFLYCDVSRGTLLWLPNNRHYFEIISRSHLWFSHSIDNIIYDINALHFSSFYIFDCY